MMTRQDINDAVVVYQEAIVLVYDGWRKATDPRGRHDGTGDAILR